MLESGRNDHTMMNEARFLRRMAPPILGVLLILGCTQSPELPSYQRDWLAVEEREPIDLSGTFKTLDGEDVPLIDSELGSKVLFLNLWATWCLPCLEEMPAMASLYEEFSDQGLAMVAVSNEDPEVVRQFLEEHPYPFTILLDPEDALALRLEVMALPTTFIVDRQKRIALRQLGSYSWDSPEMIEQFRPFLADD